ncbi:hypothetical protein GI374_03315 [Paracoccus sp. S-4012]|nr:hypothetical protein [Paracoccus sp. S-4012]
MHAETHTSGIERVRSRFILTMAANNLAPLPPATGTVKSKEVGRTVHPSSGPVWIPKPSNRQAGKSFPRLH